MSLRSLEAIVHFPDLLLLKRLHKLLISVQSWTFLPEFFKCRSLGRLLRYNRHHLKQFPVGMPFIAFLRGHFVTELWSHYFLLAWFWSTGTFSLHIWSQLNLIKNIINSVWTNFSFALWTSTWSSCRVFSLLYFLFHWNKHWTQILELASCLVFWRLRLKLIWCVGPSWDFDGWQELVGGRCVAGASGYGVLG